MRCREAGQSRMLPFLGAAALFAVLTITAHSLVLGLAAIIAGPVPAAQTALSLEGCRQRDAGGGVCRRSRPGKRCICPFTARSRRSGGRHRGLPCGASGRGRPA